MGIKRVAKEENGESKESGLQIKETWTWNEEVQATIRLKGERERERQRSIEAYTDIETMSLFKIIE